MAKLLISYDKEADVLYLNFANPTAAEAEKIEEGVFGRYHPQTGELVGVTIINFSQKFSKEMKPIDMRPLSLRYTSKGIKRVQNKPNPKLFVYNHLCGICSMFSS